MRSMVGMRNRLAHAYFDIDANIVWKTVHEELPSLVTQLRATEQKADDAPRSG